MVLIFFKQNIKSIKKFLLITGTITLIYLVAGSVVTLTLIASNNRFYMPERVTNPPLIAIAENLPDNDESLALPLDEGNLVRPPARTNFLIAGIDESNLTDTLIVGCFYRDTAEIRLMSIPRDLYTRIPEERMTRMREDGLQPPSTLKINAVRSYGRTFGTYYLLDQLGEMLGVEFHYYAEVELSDFIRIVDVMGGVWMEVPTAMQYHDPEQNLNIDISPGMQHFNGQQAEGLVRFRSYPNGDLGRNAVQMEFVKQLIRQSLTRETIMRDPLAIANFVLKDIRHNIGADALKYLPYATELKTENITTYTMPGDGRYIGGVSYFLADETALPQTILDVFYASARSYNESEDELKPRPSHGLKIQILNGSRVAGLGTNFADTLMSDGYTVVSTDSHTGSHENITRILIRGDTGAEDLLPYFKNTVIRKDQNIPAEYDIIIIIGRGE